MVWLVCSVLDVGLDMGTSEVFVIGVVNCWRMLGLSERVVVAVLVFWWRRLVWWCWYCRGISGDGISISDCCEVERGGVFAVSVGAIFRG